VKLEGTFHDVVYVPGLGINLFSIGAATDCNVNVEFTDTQVCVCVYKYFVTNRSFSLIRKLTKNS
jgi:hypothetical protein